MTLVLSGFSGLRLLKNYNEASLALFSEVSCLNPEEMQ